MFLQFRFHLVSLLVLILGIASLYGLSARAPGADTGMVIGVNCGRNPSTRSGEVRLGGRKGLAHRVGHRRPGDELGHDGGRVRG